MSNNLPLYPLLRKDRNVDIIVCFDASANIKEENWLSVAEGYAKQRGVIGWPVGAGWPRVKVEPKPEIDAADAATAQQAAGMVAETREEQRRGSQMTEDHITKHEAGRPWEADLGYCNGTFIEVAPSQHKPAFQVSRPCLWEVILPLPPVYSVPS